MDGALIHSTKTCPQAHLSTHTQKTPPDKPALAHSMQCRETSYVTFSEECWIPTDKKWSQKIKSTRLQTHSLVHTSRMDHLKKKLSWRITEKNIYRNGGRVENSNVPWMQIQSNTLTLSLSPNWFNHHVLESRDKLITIFKKAIPKNGPFSHTEWSPVLTKGRKNFTTHGPRLQWNSPGHSCHLAWCFSRWVVWSGCWVGF